MSVIISHWPCWCCRSRLDRPAVIPDKHGGLARDPLPFQLRCGVGQLEQWGHSASWFLLNTSRQNFEWVWVCLSQEIPFNPPVPVVNGEAQVCVCGGLAWSSHGHWNSEDLLGGCTDTAVLGFLSCPDS